LAGLAAVAVLGYLGAKWAFGGKEEAPAPKRKSIQEATQEALLSQAQNQSDMYESQALTPMMAESDARDALAGSLGGQLQALSDRQMLEPIRRAQFSRTEIPLTAAMAARQYEQERGWTPGPEDMQAALAQQ
jgi:hypothetical protein